MEDSSSIINTFIRASVESAPQPEIIIKAPTRDWSILSQFHTLIAIPFGMGKSTMARNVPNSFLSLNYTLASIVGTINKDGELIESALKNAAKKVLVMDEGHRLTNFSLGAILNLLESGTYNRSLGYNTRAPIKIGSHKAGFEVKTTKTLNSLDIYARFSCVMFAERIPKYFRGAFLSRFATILLETDIDDAYKFLRGESVLGFLDPTEKYKVYNENTIIHSAEYDRFCEKYEKITRVSQLEYSKNTHGYIIRNGMNVIKLAGHFARLDDSYVIDSEHIDMAMPYSLPMLKAIHSMHITPRQLEILHMITKGKMRQVEIASELGLASSTVSQAVGWLKENGFFDASSASSQIVFSDDEPEKEDDDSLKKLVQFQ